MYNILVECFIYDVDSPAYDVDYHSGISSKYACQEVCHDNANCEYFVFDFASGGCWLKSDRVSSFTTKEGIVFGPKSCGTIIVDKISIPIISYMVNNILLTP